MTYVNTTLVGKFFFSSFLLKCQHKRHLCHGIIISVRNNTDHTEGNHKYKSFIPLLFSVIVYFMMIVNAQRYKLWRFQ